MNEVFKQSDLDKLRVFQKSKSLNPVLTLEKGVLDDYISGLPSENGRYKIGRIGSSFAGFIFGLELYLNNNEDRVKINVRAEHNGFYEDGNDLHTRFHSEGNVDRHETYLRVRIISIMALLHMMPKSRLDLYMGSQTKTNLVATTTHDKYLKSMFSGKDEAILSANSFKEVFNYLWYQLNDDITRKDNALKKISMEENLIMK